MSVQMAGSCVNPQVKEMYDLQGVVVIPHGGGCVSSTNQKRV